jgi:hypothetical protein
LVLLGGLGFIGVIPEGFPEKPNLREPVFLALFGSIGMIPGDYVVFAWFFWMEPEEFEVLGLVPLVDSRKECRC